ncbi:ABC-2 family transporter protein [bacterium]|nr:ABC-2 family transporter protein [bacterium]
MSISLASQSPSITRKYATTFSVAISDRLTYRTDFLFATLMRFLPLVSIAFLWTAIFEGSGATRIAGFTQGEMVAYNLMVFISRAFSSMPGLAIGIASDIRDGQIKKYLTQPVDMISFLFVTRLAHKLVYYLLALAPFGLVIFLCRDFFPPSPTPAIWFWFIVSLAFSFVIGFMFEATIGLIAFWTLEVTSLSYLTMSVVYVLSGHMFPLDLLPPAVAEFLRWLPFQYLAYFPAKLFLLGNQMSVEMLTFEIARMIGWTLALVTLVRVLFARGLRRYSAFGG